MASLQTRASSCSCRPSLLSRCSSGAPFGMRRVAVGALRRGHSAVPGATTSIADVQQQNEEQWRLVEQHQQQLGQRQEQLEQPRLLRQAAPTSAATCAAAAALLAAAGPATAAGLGDLDAATAHSIEVVLRPLFAVFTMLYIIRIPMTWYPSIDGTKLPWLVAYGPTEPTLRATRKVIPLVGGVDITPIVWVALISFFNEILLGPQGILMLIQRQSGAGL